MNDRISSSVKKRIETHTALDWFDSVDEFVTDADKLVPRTSQYRTSTDSQWYGSDDWNATVKNAGKGWPHIIKDAEGIIEQMERDGLLSMGWKGFQPSVAGIFPNVPAALIGAPESMFDRAEKREENSTIRVFVDVGVAARVSTQALIKRGTAIAAFVLGLAARRPTELYLFAGLDGGFRDQSGSKNLQGYNTGFSSAVVRVDTRPLDLAAVSYCIASPSFYRRMFMGWAERHGYVSGWAYGLYPDFQAAEREASLRSALGLERQDVLIPATINEGPIIKAPVDWVREALTEHIIENVNVEE